MRRAEEVIYEFEVGPCGGKRRYRSGDMVALEVRVPVELVLPGSVLAEPRSEPLFTVLGEDYTPKITKIERYVKIKND